METKLMKKLSLYIFLVLLVCSNVNAGLDSKDKFIFYGCYEGNYKSTLENWGWKINLKKMTATTISITTSGKKLRLKNIQEFEEEYAIHEIAEYAIYGNKRNVLFSTTDYSIADINYYTFNIKTGEIRFQGGWVRTRIIKCKIID